MTKYVIVNQHVKNYEQWKPVFDRSEELRHEYGVRGGYITRNSEDPNEICVMLECEDFDRARELLNLPKLKQFMKESGIIGEPHCWYVEEVARVHEPAHTGH